MKNAELERYLFGEFGIENEVDWMSPPYLDPQVQKERELIQEREETYRKLMQLIGLVELQTQAERRKSADMIKRKVNDLLRRDTK